MENRNLNYLPDKKCRPSKFRDYRRDFGLGSIVNISLQRVKNHC